MAAFFGFGSTTLFAASVYEGFANRNYPRAIFEGVLAVVFAAWELIERLEVKP